MANRDSTSSDGTGIEAQVMALARAVERLAQRLEVLEAVVSNGTAPADTRFDRTVDPVTGDLRVLIVRVSNGNTQVIAGPL